jgi:hypothetical protein
MSDPRDVQHEYASDDWASETGYYLAASFFDTQDGRMQQADDIASALTTLRDHLLLRIAELEADLEAVTQDAMTQNNEVVRLTNAPVMTDEVREAIEDAIVQRKQDLCSACGADEELFHDLSARYDKAFEWLASPMRHSSPHDP